MYVLAFARDITDLDPVVKPQDDTYEHPRNQNINNIRKIKTIIQPLSFWGLTSESR